MNFNVTKKNSFFDSQRSSISWKSKIVVVMFILCLFQSLYAQNQRAIDSLKNLEITSPDSIKTKIWAQLCWEYRNNNPEEAISFGERALNLARNQSFDHQIPQILNYIGVIYRNLGVFTIAFSHFFEALQIAEKNGDILQIAYIQQYRRYLYSTKAIRRSRKLPEKSTYKFSKSL